MNRILIKPLDEQKWVKVFDEWKWVWHCIVQQMSKSLVDLQHVRINIQQLDEQNIDKTIGWAKMSKDFEWAINKYCLLLNEHKMSKDYIDFPDEQNQQLDENNIDKTI